MKFIGGSSNWERNVTGNINAKILNVRQATTVT